MHVRRRPKMTLEFHADGSRRQSTFDVPLAEATFKKVQGPMVVRGRHRGGSHESDALPDPILPRPEIHVTYKDKVYVLLTYDEKGQDEIYDALERGRQGIDELAEDLSKTNI